MLGVSCFLLGALCTYVAGKFYQHFVSEDEEVIVVEEPDYIVS